MSPYLEMHLAKARDAAANLTFPNPIVDVTKDMLFSTEITTLRQASVCLNGQSFGVALVCIGVMGKQPYVVSHNVTGKQVSTSFATQDEAELEYVIHAAVVGDFMSQALHSLGLTISVLSEKVG